MTETVTKEAMPMQGLSAWLRSQEAQLCDAPWRNDPLVMAHRETLLAWATEVEASRSLPVDGGVEPVAWRWMPSPAWGCYVYSGDRAQAEGSAKFVTVEPLYAALPSPQPSGATAEVHPKCNPHPDAPHGFNRNASHNADRYVCDCEGWDPLAGAPAVQEREVLRELVALQGLKHEYAMAAYMANTQGGQLQRDGLANCDRISAEMERIEKPLWERARALVTPPTKGQE